MASHMERNLYASQEDGAIVLILSVMKDSYNGEFQHKFLHSFITEYAGHLKIFEIVSWIYDTHCLLRDGV